MRDQISKLETFILIHGEARELFKVQHHATLEQMDDAQYLEYLQLYILRY